MRKETVVGHGKVDGLCPQMSYGYHLAEDRDMGLNSGCLKSGHSPRPTK